MHLTVHTSALFSVLLAEQVREVLSWLITESLYRHFYSVLSLSSRDRTETPPPMSSKVWIYVCITVSLLFQQHLSGTVQFTHPWIYIWYFVYFFSSSISQSILKFYLWHFPICHHPIFGIICHHCYYKMKVCIWPKWHYKPSWVKFCPRCSL